jgi:predicted nucleic acid-binding protein
VSLVLDASAVVELLLRTPRGERLESHLLGEELLAPELLDSECLSAIARLERADQVSTVDADAAIDALSRMPVHRISHLALTAGAWELRRSIRVADAFYVACAQLMSAPLLTCDARLASAPSGVAVLLVR